MNQELTIKLNNFFKNTNETELATRILNIVCSKCTIISIEKYV